MNEVTFLKVVSNNYKAKAELDSDADEIVPFELTEQLLAGANPVMEWRKYRGLTQAVLAERVGVTQTAIAGIEGGKRKPSVALLMKLADALGVDMDDLV